MDIALLADFIAPRSLQDTSHCKYSTTHLPKELQSLSPPNFSSYNCVNTSAQQAYLLEAELVSGRRVLATALSAFVSNWCCIPQYVLPCETWNIFHWFWGLFGVFSFFSKEVLKQECGSADFSPWLAAKPNLFHFVPPVSPWLLQCRTAGCVSSVLLFKSLMEKDVCVILSPGL